MKDIQEYEGLYFADKSGRIWASPKHNWKEGRFLKTWLIGHGYEMVMLYKEKQSKKFLVHRLIAQAFIPNPNNLREVNHKDGNRRNNVPENLEWVTSKQNKKHAWDNGMYTHKGECHYLSKLTEDKVRKIRQLISEGKMSYTNIGKMFDVTQGTVSSIKCGKIWNHVL